MHAGSTHSACWCPSLAFEQGHGGFQKRMIPTDQTHLRKYMTTLGVALVAGSISLAGLFFRLQGELLMTSKDLAATTPLARRTIVQRQRYLADATEVLPYVLAGGVLLGVCLAVYGLIGWARRQDVSDEIEELTREKSKAELRGLSDLERVARLEREAAAVVEGEDSVDPVSSPPETRDVLGTQPLPPARTAPPGGSVLRTQSAARAAIAQLELTLAGKLIEAFPDPWVVSVGAEVSGKGGVRRQADFVVRGTQQSYVVELKLSGGRNNIWNRVVDGISQVVSFAEMLGPNVMPVLVIVTEPGIQTSARILEQIDEYVKLFRSTPRVLLLDRVQLEVISPIDFSRLLGSD